MNTFLKYSMILFSLCVFSQNEEVDWLSFEALETKLSEKPKKVFIHLYADWCDYCKKMEEDVYSNPQISELLSENYYAVKFNVESRDSVFFGGKKFTNPNVGKSRQANHEIAELLAKRDNEPITLPTVLFFNEDFILEKRLFRYIPPKELLDLLKQ